MPALETYDVNGNPIATAPLPSLTPNLSSPDALKLQTRAAAIKKGLDPDFVTKIVNQESGFNPNAINPKELPEGGHAQGLFQFTPSTAKKYGLKNPLDPQESIEKGTDFIADLNKQYKGDKYKIAVHYNSGPGNVDKPFEKLPEETQGYLSNILGQNVATTHGSPAEVYDLNGNPIDVSKSPFLPSQPITPQQVQAKQQQFQTLSGPGQTLRNAATYAPEVLGTLGGLTPGAPNLGAGVGAGLGELVAGSAQHGIPTQEDLKNALEGGVSSFLLGKAFSLPGALRNQVVKSIESKAGKSADILEQARQDLTSGISSGSTQGEQDVLKAKLAPVKSEEEAKWEAVNKRMDKASHVIDAVSVDPATGKATTTPTPIRGPVKLSKDTLDYINSTKQQLADVVQKFPSPKLMNAYRSLNQVERALVTDVNGDSYLPFDASKQLRTDIGALTSQEGRLNLQAPTKSIGLQRGGGVLTGLRDKLGNDIESTLTDMGPDALREYGDAVGMTKTRIKANLFDKTIAKATNTGTGMLNVDKAINDFTNDASPIAREFTDGERTRIKNALNAIRNTSPQYDGALKYGAQGPGKFIFYSAYAAAHPLKFAVAVGSKDLFEKVLSQPKYARILAQLPSAPSKSSQANIMTKSLLKGALKSVPAEMIAPSGMRVSAHIDENGEPKPDFQMSQ